MSMHCQRIPTTLPPAVVLALGAALLAAFFADSSTEADAQQKADTRLAYAKVCAKAMGAIPAFDCMKGIIIPITRDGKELLAAPVDQKCDTDTWGPHGNNCVPGSRLVDLSSSSRPSVVTLALCRKDDIAVGTKSNPKFSDIAIIQHDREKGDACFFQSTMNTLDPTQRARGGRSVPSPQSDSKAAAQFWSEPEVVIAHGGAEVRALPGSCTGCHDASPFLVSPWLKAAVLKLPHGKELREKIRLAKRSLYVPDRFIGMRLSDYANRIYSLPHDENNTCTNCHRFGLSSWKRLDVANRNLHGFMPPGDKSTPDEWSTKYGAEINKIAACLSATPPLSCATVAFVTDN